MFLGLLIEKMGSSHNQQIKQVFLNDKHKKNILITAKEQKI